MVTTTKTSMGEWVIVLGASSGTGAAVARRFARSGYNVFGIHRGHYAEQAEVLVSEIQTVYQRKIHLREADAGTADGAIAGAQAFLEIAGKQSAKALIHSIANASVGPLARGHGSPLKQRQFHKTFDSMANSFVYWTQELLERELLAPSAQILGLSNSSVDHVMQGTGLIAAVKAALEMYVKHLAVELGPAGHRVNLLKFGAVVTPAVARTFGEERFAALRAVLEGTTPARRMCTVEEVADFIELLTTERLQWFNGATIDFTGSEFRTLVDRSVSSLL